MYMDKICYQTSEIISYPHGFSTRACGVSAGVYESLNLGLNRGDLQENVIKNWHIFMESTGIGYRPFVFGNQVHGNYVHIAVREDAKLPFEEGRINIEADGYVTAERDLPLAIFTADCVPCLMEDKEAGIAGAIHCGWRSTVADICREALIKFEMLGSQKENIQIALGPAIDICCFEVGPEVIAEINEIISGERLRFYKKLPNGKYMLNLRDVIKNRFEALGVPGENVDIVGKCTKCNHQNYFSHRYQGANRGSMASMIMIN